MKKTILVIASACAFIFGSSLLVSCDNGTNTSSTEETTEEHVHQEDDEHEHGEEKTTEVEVVVETSTEGAKYACPMKCEGDKTYASADDKCGKCGMDLAEVKVEETTTEEHKHEEGEESHTH